MDNEVFQVAETSLRNFFLRKKIRGKSDDSFEMMKYRGLSLGIDDENPKEVLFIVRIAALEVCFRVSDGKRVQGSLGGDERLVEQWYLLWGNKEMLVNWVKSRKNSEKHNSLRGANIEVEKKSIFSRPSFDNQNI